MNGLKNVKYIHIYIYIYTHTHTHTHIYIIWILFSLNKKGNSDTFYNMRMNLEVIRLT